MGGCPARHLVQNIDADVLVLLIIDTYYKYIFDATDEYSKIAEQVDFFPQACLVGYQNSGCEHKGNHSKEIPDPTGPQTIVPGPCSCWSCSSGPPEGRDQGAKNRSQ